MIRNFELPRGMRPEDIRTNYVFRQDFVLPLPPRIHFESISERRTFVLQSSINAGRGCCERTLDHLQGEKAANPVWLTLQASTFPWLAMRRDEVPSAASSRPPMHCNRRRYPGARMVDLEVERATAAEEQSSRYAAPVRRPCQGCEFLVTMSHLSSVGKHVSRV